jgi:hypothetical protein
VLGAGLGPGQHAVLGLMLGFHAWRALVREGGLEQGTAVEAAVRAIGCAGGGPASGVAEAEAGPAPR